jgi:ketopantoate reductase
MNERIKELAEQADIVFGFDKNNDPEVICAVMDIEKFAELIIRECVDVCRKENWKTLGQDTKGMKQFDRGIIAGRKSMSYDLCDKIEQRFGIQ